MELSKKQKNILMKRKIRKFLKFMFGLIFRTISYNLIFARHLDENWEWTGGRWCPSEEELNLVNQIKENKKTKKLQKKSVKDKIKSAKKTTTA